jgi:hypothetical protein
VSPISVTASEQNVGVSVSGGQGPAGPQGATGAAGPANTLAVGTVTSGATAAATITGTAPNQTLNLTLPKGDAGAAGATGPAGQAGPQGPQGPQGATGPQGDPGVVSATAPVTYASQTVGLSVGAGLTTSSGALVPDFGSTSGTVCQGNDARLSDTRTPTAHAHAASDITSGTIATARLGSGTASASTYLRGDQTYAEPVTSVNGSTGAVTLPTMVEFTMAGGPAGSTLDSFAGYRSYTWTFPTSAQYAIVEVQGAGAGGGSGRRGAAGTNRGGGGGGAAGPLRRVLWRLADLPGRTASFQVAAGGAGGAAVTANDTAGNQGSQPATVTLIQGQWSGFPVLVRAAAPGNGGGGTTSGGSGGNGAAASSSDPFGGTSGGAGGVGAAGTAGGSALAEASTGGGGGGGLDTANTTRAGGAGGGSQYIGASTGGAAGTAGGGAGTAGSGFGASICATGGGGGGSAVGAAGGAGGNGTKGSGGGGGGASENGFASGAGGNGGDGYIRVILF